MPKQKQKGSMMIELVAVAPFVAAFMLIVLQFAVLFGRALENVSYAESKAKNAVRAWEIAHYNTGFLRPCIEKITPNFFVHDALSVTVGFGVWKKSINIPEEVRIVPRPVCVFE